MCTTDPGGTLLLGLVATALLGGLPLGLAWRALRRGTRGARLAVVSTVLVLALLTVLMRPSGDLPEYGPVRQALHDMMSYGLTWVFLALALAWGAAAAWPARGVQRAAFALTFVPLLMVAAWAGYAVLGPDACAELMRPPTPRA